MALRIRHKLIIAFSLFALFVTFVAFFAMLFTFRAGFLQYLNDLRYASLQHFSQTLSEQITTEDDWHLLVSNKRVWDELIRRERKDKYNFLSDQHSHKRFKDKDRSHHFHKKRARKLSKSPFILLDQDKHFIYGKKVPLDELWLEEIKVSKQTRGFIGVKSLQKISSSADTVFVEKQTRLFIGVAVVACVLAIIIAVLLANWMAAPIQRLVSASNRLMQRDYSVQVKYKGKDEIAGLVQAFNRLAQSLADHQTTQQQWIADISHELRTPLSTLKAELEAVQDGIRALSIERIHSLYDEVMRLQRLVDDLHELSLSDAGTLNYRFSSVDLKPILESVFESHEADIKKKKLSFSLDFEGDASTLQAYADSDRLYQLFENLLQNSLRYTDEGGKINVAVFLSNKKVESQIRVEWEDSAPSVSIEALGKLFDRLYREEQSRNRAKGGSGLGLSICKSIVEAHGGIITAKASSLGGLKISITLPGARA